MSAEWAVALPDGVEIVGFVDLDASAAERLAGNTGAATGTDLAAMLRDVRPDVVFDCTVPDAHREVTLTALRAGCHVLGEKPMAETLADARVMVAAAKEAGRIYAVSQNYRYALGVGRFRQMLPDIGSVTTLHSDFFLAHPAGGFRDRLVYPLLFDMAIHTFDTARFLLDSDPVSVFCHSWNPAGSWYPGAASAACIFEMSNGAVFTYRGSWCAEGLRTDWNGTWRAIGNRGTVVWDGASAPHGEVVASVDGPMSRPLNAPPEVEQAADVQAVIREFVGCVAAGTAPQTVCTDNIKTLAMVLGAMESSQKGERVTIAI